MTNGNFWTKGLDVTSYPQRLRFDMSMSWFIGFTIRKPVSSIPSSKADP